MHFKEFISEQKNTHMTHIEDKVLYGGVDGTRQAILALRSLRDMVAGVKDGNVSVKWDGATLKVDVDVCVHVKTLALT